MKTFLFGICLMLIAVSAATAQKAGTPQKEITEVVYEGKTFRKGDRVKITSSAGTMKPKETGFSKEINADEGKTGTVMRGEKRVATSYFKPDPNEPIQIVRVKWDAQKWLIDEAGSQTIFLKPFDSTINLSYLEVIPKTAAKSKPKKRKS